MLDREGGESLHKRLLLYKLQVKRTISVFLKKIYVKCYHLSPEPSRSGVL